MHSLIFDVATSDLMHISELVQNIRMKVIKIAENN